MRTHLQYVDQQVGLHAEVEDAAHPGSNPGCTQNCTHTHTQSRTRSLTHLQHVDQQVWLHAEVGDAADQVLRRARDAQVAAGCGEVGECVILC